MNSQSKTYMSEAELPMSGFLTLQFLFEMERSKTQRPFLDVHMEWLSNSKTDPPLRQFQYANPAVLLMGAYIVLVFPLEFWRLDGNDESTINLLQEWSKDHLATIPGCTHSDVQSLFTVEMGPPRLFQLLKGVRNALAHARVMLDSDDHTLVFTDINLKKSLAPHFRARIPLDNFAVFLSCLGSFFANNRMTIP